MRGPGDEEALREKEMKRLQRKIGELPKDLDILKEANKPAAEKALQLDYLDYD